MKLYVSSSGIGNDPEKLKALLPINPKALYISNAIDRYGDNDRARASKEKDMQELRDVSVSVDPLDLREYFGRQHELAQRLNGIDLVWVSGGNTFDLRIAMRRSGFDETLRSLIAKDIVYGGCSAGICVLSQTLRGYDITDSPEGNPYGEETMWEGIGLIDWMFVPHFDSDHEESEDAMKEIAYYTGRHLAYKTLRDGESFVIMDPDKAL